ncbi:MAG: hypothetical protein AMXMBFR61_08440 [Fimbriimonadales bacterium]
MHSSRVEAGQRTAGPYYEPDKGKWQGVGRNYVAGSYHVNLGITTITASLDAMTGTDITISGDWSAGIEWPGLCKASVTFRGSETISEHASTKVSVPIPPCGWGETEIYKEG